MSNDLELKGQVVEVQRNVEQMMELLESLCNALERSETVKPAPRNVSAPASSAAPGGTWGED